MQPSFCPKTRHFPSKSVTFETEPHFQRAVLDGASAHKGYHHSHDVDGELELEELGDRVVHVPAPHHRLDDAGEVVVRQDDVRRLLGHVSAGDTLMIFCIFQRKQL